MQTYSNPKTLISQQNSNLNMINLFLRFFEWICALNIGVFFYFLLNIKRLFKYFIELWTILLMSLRGSKKKFYEFQSVKYYSCALQPISSHRLFFLPRKILILDLDETLIHSHHDGFPRVPTFAPVGPPDFLVRMEIERNPVRFFVYKRPHVDYFLDIVSQWYDLVIFTASMEIYGSAVTDRLDNNRNILSRRFYRQSCKFERGVYTKDLSAVNSDLSRVFILDNSPVAYQLFPNNAIPIKSWFSDPSDTCLLSLLPFLDALRFCRDVRSVLAMNLHLHRDLFITQNNSLTTQVVPSTR